LKALSTNSKLILLFVLFLQFTLDITVLFDVPVVRQVIGFLCLTFVSGFIILKLLKFDKLDNLELVLFSAGFSIALIVLASLFLNEIGSVLNVLHPLSLIPLLTILNILILTGGVSAYLKGINEGKRKNESNRKSPFLIIFLCLPILSVIGATYVAYGNNTILLLLIVLISASFIVSVLSNKLTSPNMYPLAIFAFAIALLYHSSFISNYIVPFGSDVPGEFSVFRTVEANAHWISTSLSAMGPWYSRQNAMLSITILPTIYKKILNIDPSWVFKILYPLIFSLVPLGLYQIWQSYVGKKYAFISAFLFMAFEPFYTEMLGLNRQMIAEVFFVLLLLVLLKKEIKPTNRMVSFMIFSFALITSHYALAVIFLFFISSTLVILTIMKHPSKTITVPMVILFFVIMFAWYIYTSKSAAFNSILEYGDHVYRQLNDFFNPASRGEEVLTGLGLTKSPSIWNTISRIFSYLTQAFIVFGFIELMIKRTKIRVKNEYFIFSVIAVIFLAMLILIPGLANTLKMTRFYHILLFFLAPLCVVGAESIIKILSKKERQLIVYALLLIVLIPYFLFQTEFVFEVVGSDSWSIPLSGYRMNPLRLYARYGYMDSYSVYGAHWLSNTTIAKDKALYADERTLTNVLTTYASVYKGYPLSNVTILTNNSIVYLSTLNVIYGVIPFGSLSCSTNNLSIFNDDLNLIYDNGGAEVYQINHKH